MCTRHSVRYREKEKIVPPRLTSGSTNLVQSRGKDRVKVEKRTEMDLKNTTERYNEKSIKYTAGIGNSVCNKGHADSEKPMKNG